MHFAYITIIYSPMYSYFSRHKCFIIPIMFYFCFKMYFCFITFLRFNATPVPSVSCQPSNPQCRIFSFFSTEYSYQFPDTRLSCPCDNRTAPGRPSRPASGLPPDGARGPRPPPVHDCWTPENPRCRNRCLHAGCLHTGCLPPRTPTLPEGPGVRPLPLPLFSRREYRLSLIHI